MPVREARVLEKLEDLLCNFWKIYLNLDNYSFYPPSLWRKKRKLFSQKIWVFRRMIEVLSQVTAI